MRKKRMSSETVKSSGGGMGFFGALFLILLWLKLNPGGNFTTPITDWSWWWISAPLWGPLAFAAIIFLIWFISLVFLKVAGKK